jgi:tRNA ligase
MIADRNNHQKRERKQIIEDVQKIIPNAHFVALHYVHDPKDKMLPNIRKVTRDRVLSRGDNHQTIQAGSKSQQEIIGIMEGFLNRFEPVDPHSSPDDIFDEVINLDVAASSRNNLEQSWQASTPPTRNSSPTCPPPPTQTTPSPPR